MAKRIGMVLVAMVATTAGASDFNDARPNADWQKPALPDQTRAPVIDDPVALRQDVVADGLAEPWGMAELPDGRWLVTERAGALRLVTPEGGVSDPIAGIPEVDNHGQGGLLDVAIAPDFAETRRLWWTFAEPRGEGRNGTSVATGVLAEDGSALTGVEVIFQQHPAWDSTLHYGSRLVFDAEGHLFVTTGERSAVEPRRLAQDAGTHLGKVLRLDPGSGPAPGNPQIEGGLPEVWSLGHRNLQSAAIGPDGALWTVEHGPRGGDELNRPEPGKNYGWPVITYGEGYSGMAIGEGETTREGMEQPVYYWDPVIAPSGMAFYDGDLFPAWQGSALIGGLRAEALVRLTIEDGRVTGEARYLEGTARFRDVAVARDGSVMLLTDEANGRLIRVTPKD